MTDEAFERAKQIESKLEDLKVTKANVNETLISILQSVKSSRNTDWVYKLSINVSGGSESSKDKLPIGDIDIAGDEVVNMLKHIMTNCDMVSEELIEEFKKL